MDVKVRFRFNKLSGEVERFEVEQDSSLPYVEHEREHDRVAAEIGALLERFPRVTELPGDAPAVATTSETPQEPTEDEESVTDKSVPEVDRER